VPETNQTHARINLTTYRRFMVQCSVYSRPGSDRLNWLFGSPLI